MMNELEKIVCDTGTAWSFLFNRNMDVLRAYINTLETTQKTATDAVSSEIGAARSGAATLLAKIQDMDDVSDDLKSVVQGLAAGVGPVVYDPATSYKKNDVVVYDGGLYICIAADPESGVVPPAENIWKNMLGWEKTSAPTLSGPPSAPESTVQRISLGASYNANARYWPTVSGGIFSDLMQFPADEKQYAGEWGWEWHVPTVDADTVYSLVVYSTTDGFARSNDVNHALTVRDVPVVESTVVWGDTADNYQQGTVEDGEIAAPAHTVGCDSVSQVTSAKPEVTVIGVSELPEGFGVRIGAGATGEYLGPRRALNIPKAVVETAQTTSTAEGADTVIGDVIIPAGVTVTKLGAKMAVALSSGGKIAIVKTSDGEHYTVAAIADYTNTGAMTMQYVSLASSFVVPNDGDTYRIACYRSSGNNTVFIDDTSDYLCRSTGVLSSVGDTITAITTKYGAITGYERISPTPSTATKIVIETAESIKNNIYVAGGFHNRIEVDGQLYEVESVSEIENNGVYTTTITLENALPEVPTADTVIAIPDRCTLSPADYTITPDGDDIKITGEEIVLEDNPDIKRLAMAVSGPEGLKFRGACAHIKRMS